MYDELSSVLRTIIIRVIEWWSTLANLEHEELVNK